MTENWWTRVPDWQLDDRTPLEICRGRVHFWLAMYPQLARALQDVGPLDASDGGVGTASDMTWWERYVTTKADLDMALKHCTERQQEAVRARFHKGLPYREAGELLGIAGKNVHALCHRALDIIAERLAGRGNKTRG